MCVFFFQAEDGIRDLVRSRGLGDVYKRQGLRVRRGFRGRAPGPPGGFRVVMVGVCRGRRAVSVSYTHLTLPTSDLV